MPLYTTFPTEALALSHAIFVFISTDKLAKVEGSDPDNKFAWEEVQNSILSGILVCHDVYFDYVASVQSNNPFA